MSKQPSLTKAAQRQVDAAAEIFRPWGYAWTVEVGGKHLVMKIVHPRDRRLTGKLVIACTPKDADSAATYARQNARRLLNEINQRVGLWR